MITYKLQVQDDDAQPLNWRDVKSGDGSLLVFDKEPAAREALVQLFPVLVKLEKFAAGPKRTRVVVVNSYSDIDEEKES